MTILKEKNIHIDREQPVFDVRSKTRIHELLSRLCFDVRQQNGTDSTGNELWHSKGNDYERQQGCLL